jgi:hypothetical protein
MPRHGAGSGLHERADSASPVWQTCCVMAIEIWQRLCGYRKWIRTEATILSSELTEVEVAQLPSRYSEEQPIVEGVSHDVLAWTDEAGQRHTGEYAVSEDSPLYQLYDGQTVTILYNPADPDEFYLRGVLRSKAISFLKWGVLPALGAVCYFLLTLLRSILRRH